LFVVLGGVATLQSCRWPELLRASLLADGGTYMLGATFGQPVLADDNVTTTLSPGIMIWTTDDNASVFVAPVGGTLEWFDDADHPGVGTLRLTPRPTGEGGEPGDDNQTPADPLPARTDLFAQRIEFRGLDRASVENEMPLFDDNASFAVEPGDRLGQAARVASWALKHIPDPAGGDDIVLNRRLLLTVSAAEHPAYVDPYLFFPQEVDGIVLSPEHDSLLADNTAPDITDDDIRLYPHAPGQSIAPLQPRDPNEPIPHYNVPAGQVLDLALLARDLGAGACSAGGCVGSSDLIGIESITYYITDDSGTGEPVLGPITVDLRCLDASRFDSAEQTDPTSGIYRSDVANPNDGFLYDVTAMRSRNDACLTYDSGSESVDTPDSEGLAVDTGLLVPDTTYSLVVSARSYGAGGQSTPPSSAPGLPDTAPFSSAPGAPPTDGHLDKVVEVKVSPFFARPPPRIDLSGPIEIDAGQTIRVETSVTTNDYGEALTFRWEIVQAPATSPIPEGEYADATGSVISIDTDDRHAGMWVLRLTARDEHGPLPMVATDEYSVLVNGTAAPDTPVSILPDSESWLSVNAAKENNDFVTVHYAVDDGEVFTEVRTRVYEEGQTEPIYDQTEPTTVESTVLWDGRVPLVGVVPAGRYRITVTPLGPAGVGLGESARFPLVAYSLDLAMDGVSDVDEESPGAYLAVGSTVHPGHVALEPEGLDGEIVLQEIAPTTALEAGLPGGDLATGIVIVAAAASPQADLQLRVRERPMTEVRLRARYLPLGAPQTKAAVDEVVIDPVELDVTALCSADDREETDGIFVQRRKVALPPPLDFAAGRFMMRELYLTSSHRFDGVHVSVRPAGPATGGATVFQAPSGVSVDPTALGTDGNIDSSAFDANGVLDTELFVRGLQRGEAQLVVELIKDGSVLASDTIRLRIGDLPPLAGQALPTYPHWRGTRAVSIGQSLGVALDPAYHDERRTLPAKVYVVEHKTAAQWASDATLTDVTGGSEDLVVPAAPGTITTSQTSVWPQVDVPVGTESRALDVVIDYGGCPSAATPVYGTLDPEDIILPLEASAPSLVALGDLTAEGPYQVATFEYGNDFENGDDFKNPAPVEKVCTPREDLGWGLCDPASPGFICPHDAVCVDDDGDGNFHCARVRPPENASGAVCPPPCPNGEVCWDGDHDGTAHCKAMNLPEDTGGAVCPPGCPVGSGCYDTDGDNIAHCTAVAPACAADETCVSTNGDEVAHCRPRAPHIQVPPDFDTKGRETTCTGGDDDDHDGKTDCADIDCLYDVACGAETSCTDGVDNNNNSRTDCDDIQCLQECFPGFRLRARVVYPDPVPPLAPLVVIAHGRHPPLNFLDYFNGGDWERWHERLSETSDQNYRGHRYLQEHLASHGFVTLSVDLDEAYGGSFGYPAVGYGNRLRGWIILKNIEHAFQSLPQLAEVDRNQIYLIGHSRGGEAVLEAWWILGDVAARGPGANVTEFARQGIRGVMSIAPTSFYNDAPPLGPETPYFLLYGTADGDVNGTVPVVQPRRHYDRADGPRAAIQLRGANHNHFNTSWVRNDTDRVTIPAHQAPLLGGDEQREAAMAWGLAWLRMVQGKDGFAELFDQPATRLPVGGVAPDVVAYTQSSHAPATTDVIDNYEEDPSDDAVTSEDYAVAATGLAIEETELSDPHWRYQGDIADYFLGDTHGAIITWTSESSLTVTLPQATDLRERRAVVLRAAQQPRHPNTTALDGSLAFRISLITTADDNSTMTSTVPSDVATVLNKIYVAEVDVPGLGPVDSSAALFQTIRIDLERFVVGKPDFNLGNITAIRLDFASDGGSSTGAIGLDDLEFER